DARALLRPRALPGTTVLHVVGVADAVEPHPTLSIRELSRVENDDFVGWLHTRQRRTFRTDDGVYRERHPIDHDPRSSADRGVTLSPAGGGRSNGQATRVATCGDVRVRSLVAADAHIDVALIGGGIMSATL